MRTRNKSFREIRVPLTYSKSRQMSMALGYNPPSLSSRYDNVQEPVRPAASRSAWEGAIVTGAASEKQRPMKRPSRRQQRRTRSREAGTRTPGAAARLLANPAPRFCILFLILLAVLGGLSATSQAQKLVHEPLSLLLVRLAAPILSTFGTVVSSGTYLSFNTFSASVEEACDGVLPSCIFVSAVLAFPCRPRQKAWGVLLGITAIFFINLLRVITLMVVGFHWPDLFERVHIYVWQALVIALSMALWVFWAEYFVQRGSPAGA